MKYIYDTSSTRVPVSLIKKVRLAHESRVKAEPKLRMIDVWAELEKKVKMK